MIAEVLLDCAAMILPLFGLRRLRKSKATPWGVRAGNLVRLNLYFLSATIFDVLRNLGLAWAAYGLQLSVGFIFAVVGLMAANLYFCPECNSLREAWSRLKSRTSLLLYEGIVFGWVGVDILFPSLYLPVTVMLLMAGAVYPAALFRAARTRAKPVHVKNALTTLSVTWVLFITLSMLLFALGAQPPVLPISVPLAWEMAFLTGSILFFTMTLSAANPLGSVKFPSGQLVPETIIKPGHRYLVLHDSGKRAITFLASTLKDLIDSGSRIIINPPTSGWLVTSLTQAEPRFNEWRKNGKVVMSDVETDQESPREGLSERLSFGPVSNIYLQEINKEDLQDSLQPPDSESDKHRASAEILMLDSSKAPRPQLTEFLRQNNGVELLNLSESTQPFSSLFGLEHQKLRGSIILFEYDNTADSESAVDKFLAEGLSNAELCVLLTTKSSKLYRAIKGRRMIKIIAASSLISAPDELPDGEMQIP
ncbi:hypothetical protein J2P12_02360, partial [Candidatus Bathyarchaeota archaeon]|nr:hypothetical protein [Candidatus Bathyarchaeota archaeon]